MIVSRIMIKNPIFARLDMPVNEVRALMNKEQVGYLPVLDKDNKLIGIVSKNDMFKAGPSPATTLDMYEISYLLSKLKVDAVMTKNVITVNENEVIEEAARIMADNEINCLPVLRGKMLVGIVTASDIFHFFVNAFGARHQGVRVSFSMEEKPGQIAKLSAAIAEKGGNLVAFVTQEADDLSKRNGTLKITGLDKQTVEDIFRHVQADLLDIRC